MGPEHKTIVSTNHLRVGLGHELEPASPGRALGGLLAALIVLAAVLVLYYRRHELLPRLRLLGAGRDDQLRGGTAAGAAQGRPQVSATPLRPDDGSQLAEKVLGALKPAHPQSG